ncbi:ribosome biogenesis GTPase YlqF [Heliophilum fasciatum]|uniref:Ribosome biogenesis GTPase A n=1 Tax=Heliophilum fasciatum TaxID=35700 RepID=A0A4R2RUP6_9FIRM|nr:ribosome biogenesis GTPase YlqF [Heliophilum fasciatum]MCW2278440.1 ribosome biogenesis GTPase A [Heliophilum fasciatum]TCP63661.1 ribosome biogenesis GTPase A [Heliophilum fasciatum]
MADRSDSGGQRGITVDTSIQWYPGHMTRARRQVTADLAKVDLAIELVDARIPLSSRNPDIDTIIGEKPRLILLNKADLADPDATRRFVERFRQAGLRSLVVEASTGKGTKQIGPMVEQALGPLLQRWQQRGMRPRPLRVMILGIPNVGKSSLINRLAGSKRTVTANRPGVTRGQQWVRFGEKLELLDTPGILWPKFTDPLVALKLAATGAVSDLVVDVQAVARFILLHLRVRKPALLQERYRADMSGVEEAELLDIVGRRYGFLLPGNLVDQHKAAVQVLVDFRAGKLGHHTLDDDHE